MKSSWSYFSSPTAMVCRALVYEFYQKLGFVIVGVMPDANSVGKPDIYLAKRVGNS